MYQHDDSLREYTAKVVSVEPITSLSEADRTLLKNASDDVHVVTTDETIFYVQGGGQLTDTGSMTAGESSDDSFEMLAARKASDGRVLHFGRFSGKAFAPGQAVKQTIDAEKRDLYSRIHDAGHIVGLVGYNPLSFFFLPPVSVAYHFDTGSASGCGRDSRAEPHRRKGATLARRRACRVWRAH